MATSVADLSINVSANIAQAVEGMSRLSSSVNNAARQLTMLNDVGRNFAGGFIGGLAGAFSISAITEMVTGVIRAAASLDDLAEKTGASVESLSKFAGVARVTGQDLGAIESSMSKLSKALVEAQDDGSKAARAFAAFGINIKDASGNLRNSGEVMDELARNQQNFSDGAGKSATMMQLLGKSGASLIPFMNDYVRLSGEISVTTAEQAQRAEDLQIQIGLLQERINKLTRDAILPLIPQIMEVIRSFESLGEAIANLEPSGKGPLEGFLESIKETNRETVGELAFLKQAVENFQTWWKNSSALDVTKVALGGKPQQFAGMIDPSAAKAAAMLTAENKELAKVTRELPPLMEATSKATATAAVRFAAGAGGADKYAQALTSMQKTLRDVEAQAENLGRSVSEQVAPSMKRLADLMGSPEWATFNSSQQETIKRQAENAAGVWRLVEAYKAQVEAQERLGETIRRNNEAQFQASEKIRLAMDSFVEGLQAENEEITFQITLIGKTAVEQERLIALRQIDLEVQRQLNALGDDYFAQQGVAIIQAGEAAKKRLEANLALKASMESQQVFLEQQQAGWANLFEGITNRGAEFIEDFAQNGSSAFKRLWEDFKSWALSALAKIAAQEIVVSLTGVLSSQGGGGLAGIASQLTGGGGGGGLLSQLAGGGGGLGDILGGALGGLGSSAAAGLFSSFGGAGAAQAAALAAQTAGFGMAGTAATLSALGGAGGLMAGAASAVLAAVPVVGWIAAAGIALYSIFGKDDPSETKGRIGIRAPGAGGFEDDQVSQSKLGDVGFLDVDTMYFSGEVAQALTDMLSGALDAFAYRMDEEGQDRLAKILQETTFEAFEGTFTTEDFLKKFGGEALQQVVEIAFNELAPALGAVMEGFSGTAEEVANFSNTLLGIYDVTRELPEAVRENILGALDATQETADKVLAFAAALQSFGGVLEGVGPQLEALDPASIIAFVDALGGAQNVAQSFAFLSQNFLTDAERFNLATESFNAAFEAIGLTIEDLANAGLTGLPQTHEEFMRLLTSFDLTTEAGRELYTSVLGLSQAFVVINGTAQSAQEAMEALDAELAGGLDFIDENFRTQADRAARATADLAEAFADIGLAVPESHAAFLKMLDGIDRTTDAGRALYTALVKLAPAFVDVNGAVKDLVNELNKVNVVDLGSVGKQVRSEFARIMDGITNLVGQMGGDMGEKLSQKMRLIAVEIERVTAGLGNVTPGSAEYQALLELIDKLRYANGSAAEQLARFTILTAQYDAERAGALVDLGNWYAEQQALYAGNAEALAALEKIMTAKWVEIVNGVGTGVTGTISELERLRQGIADWLKGLTVGELSPLKPMDRLKEAEKQFLAIFDKAKGGDKDALSNITKFAEQYLRIARDLFKSSDQYTEIFDMITTMLAGLAGTSPTGLPYPPDGPPVIPTAPDLSPGGVLAAAMPANGRPIASTDDIRWLAEVMRETMATTIGALADANTADSELVVEELTATRRTLDNRREVRK